MIFPIGYEIIPGINYKKPIRFGEYWQILKQSDIFVLIVQEKLYSKWFELKLLEEKKQDFITFNENNYIVIKSNSEDVIEYLENSKMFIDDHLGISLSEALNNTRSIIDKNYSLYDGIFIEKLNIILPTFTCENDVTDDILLGKWVTGGVEISINSIEKVSEFSCVSNDALFKIYDSNNEKVDTISTQKKKKEKRKVKGLFHLPGRPELEKFFNEHIIDIVQNEERYKALGIDFPSSIILYGPPGTGKTYAVEQLAEYLSWSIYHINSSSIASAYMHETSRKIAEVFDQAIEAAPSIIIIDEMEAYLSNRENGHQHNVEEVAEFLRRIPDAINKKVLIIAMTNKLDMIDTAVLRRGRFDHQILVDYAKEEEISAMLKANIAKIAVEDDLDIKKFAKKLSGKPMSDIAFFIKEGARLAAKDRKNKLDNESLEKALKETLSKPSMEEKKVGFIKTNDNKGK